jgi:hypothetical protein
MAAAQTVLTLLLNLTVEAQAEQVREVEIPRFLAGVEGEAARSKLERLVP